MNITYYFVYRYIYIQGIGGTFPPNDENVEFGFGNYKDWYLGKTTSLEYIQKIKEFKPQIINKNIFDGFQLLNIDKICYDKDENGNFKFRDLTEKELNLKNEAKFYFDNKITARIEIEEKVGDIPDLIADISKRIVILERLVYHIMDSILLEKKGNKIDWEILYNKYFELCDYYTRLISEKNDPIDLKLDIKEEMKKLVDRNDDIYSILISKE